MCGLFFVHWLNCLFVFVNVFYLLIILFIFSIAEHGQALNIHKQLLEDYNGALDTYLSWLTEQESVADILLEEVKANDPVRSSTWAPRSKVRFCFFKHSFVCS